MAIIVAYDEGLNVFLSFVFAPPAHQELFNFWCDS